MTTAAPALKPGETPPAVNPETHDSVSGKTWKQLHEEERTAREAAERKASTPSAPATSAPTESDRDAAVQKWKKEKEDQFAQDPIGTIAKMIGEGAQTVVRGTARQMKEAAVAIRAVKGELRKKYETSFAQYEQEFEDRVESLDIRDQADKAVLTDVFLAIRGAHLTEGAPAARPAAAGGGDPAARIVGPTTPGSGAGAPGGPAGQPTLTSTQQAEFDRSGLSSEKVYLQRLEERQERARKLGMKKPVTLSEPLHKE